MRFSSLFQLRVIPHSRKCPQNLQVRFIWNRIDDPSQLSVRGLRRRRPPPYQSLYNAIHRSNPEAAHVYQDPDTERDLSFFVRGETPPSFSYARLNAIALHHANDARDQAILEAFPALWTVTAKLIRGRDSTVSPHSAYASAWENVTPEELGFLERHGCNKDDVETWANILLDVNAESALSSIQTLVNDRPNTPLFLISVYLKRQHLSSHALQAILDCAWKLLRSPAVDSRYQDNQIFVIFCRLIRHASSVWVRGFPSIAALLTTFVPYRGGLDLTQLGDRGAERVISLTDKYNAALRLISRSPTIQPYLSHQYYQEACAMIVSRMVRFNPPLQLSSVGFTALAECQVKAPKTNQERDWAQLKMRSWPPWPKPRTAKDEAKGFEYGTSRSVRTLQLMHEAGYAHPSWEKVLKVYGGWDDSGVPTIQTRHLFLQDWQYSDGHLEYEYWAAKIRVSRDVREAWARFLEYEATSLPPAKSIFLAMFEKVSAEARRVSDHRKFSPEVDPVDGDSRDVLAPVTAQKHRVFLPNEPPSFGHLLRMMSDEEKMQISPSMIAQLLQLAPTQQDFLDVWSVCTGDELSKRLLPTALRKVKEYDSRPSNRQNEHTLLLEALIEGLCKYPWSNFGNLFFTNEQLQDLKETYSSLIDLDGAENFAVLQALHLCKIGAVQKTSVWRGVVNGLSTSRREVAMAPPKFLLLDIILDMLEHMSTMSSVQNIDFLDSLCVLLERSGLSARFYLAAENITRQLPSRDIATAHLELGAKMLRRLFTVICGSAERASQPVQDPTDESAPRIAPHGLLPTSGTAHHYIRALAAFHDYEGLLSFARWVAAHETDLAEFISREPGGQRRWLITRAAFRLAMTRPELLQNASGKQLEWVRPSSELAAMCESIWDGMKTLGPWASAKDAAGYADYIEPQRKERVVEGQWP